MTYYLLDDGECVIVSDKPIGWSYKSRAAVVDPNAFHGAIEYSAMIAMRGPNWQDQFDLRMCYRSTAGTLELHR